MGKLGERLLPLLLAVIAGLVLALGIRGFRAEQPQAFRLNPFSTTPLVTEASPTITQEVALADGSTLLLRPGTIAFDLAQFLSGSDSPPHRFDLAGVNLPLSEEDARSRQALFSLATVLRAWPTAQIQFTGEGIEAVQVIGELQAIGIDPARMTVQEATPAPAPRSAKNAADKAVATQPQPDDNLPAAPLQLILTHR